MSTKKFDKSKSLKFLGKRVLEYERNTRPTKDFIHKLAYHIKQQAPKEKERVFFYISNAISEGDSITDPSLIGLDANNDVCLKVPLLGMVICGCLQKMLYLASHELSQNDKSIFTVFLFAAKNERFARSLADGLIARTKAIHDEIQQMKVRQTPPSEYSEYTGSQLGSLPTENATPRGLNPQSDNTKTMEHLPVPLTFQTEHNETIREETPEHIDEIKQGKSQISLFGSKESEQILSATESNQLGITLNNDDDELPEDPESSDSEDDSNAPSSTGLEIYTGPDYPGPPSRRISDPNDLRVREMTV
eukprot:m.341720 g.341720  ORF g.341720 m.341720 type:complete len:305 (-) comp20434_c0_seq1:54-968(-)